LSLNPSRSRQAKLASLAREARAAEAASRIPEAITLLREAVQLDPHECRTLHWLGTLFRIRLNRLKEAATWYAREARAHERDDHLARALAAWRLVLACESLYVEAHERIGAIYAETGRLADARQHYDSSERVLREAGLGREASILRAQREALEEPAPTPPARPPAAADTPAPPPALDAAPDGEADAYAEERLARARLFHHYGLDAEARRLLEEALAIAPEHAPARQLLAEVCRAVGDAEAAAHHLDVLVLVLRRLGQAVVLPSDDPVGMPPIEEWDPEDARPEAIAGTDAAGEAFVDLLEDVRGALESLVDRLQRPRGRG
jgi:tetratricopeptide (TPR) repeat protein